MELEPENWQALFAQAKILNEEGRYKLALDCINRAIQNSKNKPETYLSRSTIFLRMSRYHETIEDCQKVVAHDLASIDLKWRANNNIGVAYYELGNYELAEKYYLEAKKMSKTSALILYNLGELKFLQGKKSEALKFFSDGIKIDSGDKSFGYNSVGVIQQSEKENQLAEDAYLRAIDCDPKNIKAHINLARLLEGNNNKRSNKEAQNHYDRAIELGSDEAISLRQLLRIRSGLGGIDLNTEIANPKSSWEQILNILIKHKDNESLQSIGELYARQLHPILEGIKQISLGNNSEKKTLNRKIAHYTSLKVADLLLMGKSRRLRYSNEVFMNDPQEGKILFQCLEDFEFGLNEQNHRRNTSKIWQAIEQAEANYEPSCYIGSFIPATDNHEDELVMWRTYGKDEKGNEASGCCIVLEEQMFDRLELDNISTVLEEQKFKRQFLYQVLYYNTRNKRFENSELQDKMSKLADQVKNILNETEKYAKEMESIIKEQFIQAVNEIIFLSLSDIRYLFKSADYQFESELRVMHYAPAHSGKLDHKRTQVNIDEHSEFIPRRLYIESSREVKQYIDKIIIGPKVINPEKYHYLKAKSVIDCKKSEKPIEVQKSTCQYQ